jgi:putative oxidoreductase
MYRSLPGPAGDWALLLTRVVIGIVMFAHGYQKLAIDGIGQTTRGFESLSIPIAIVSASFVTVVEFAGSLLMVAGVATMLVAALELITMVGAAIFVHIPNGIFVADGGWELVGILGAGLLGIAATGPGRYSVAHVLRLGETPATPTS